MFRDVRNSNLILVSVRFKTRILFGMSLVRFSLKKLGEGICSLRGTIEAMLLTITLT